MWCRGVVFVGACTSHAQLQNPFIVEVVWKVLPEKVIVL